MAVSGGLWAGILAGLGVALPLGAIGVLLVTEGVRRGWRGGQPAAAGVASVDAIYAIASVLLGAAVVRLVGPHAREVGLVGAVVLLRIAGWGLLGVLRSPAPEQVDAAPSRLGSYARFVGLTALNPLTALYFVALTVSLGSALRGFAGAAFVVGVFAASLAWQSALVGVGALAGASLAARGRRAISVVGYLVVAGYALVLALG